MNDLAAAAALVLAGIFLWAAVAKVAARTATVASFRGLGLPVPGALATGVPALEVALAAGLVVAPAVAAYAALALLLAFSIVVGRAVAGGSTVGCACFGGGAQDRPVSVLALVRNGGLGGLAVVATGAGSGDALWPAWPALVVVTVVVALAGIVFAAVEMRRAGGHPFSKWRRGDGIG